MFTAVEIIGVLLIVVGIVCSLFSGDKTAGLGAINIGLFFVVVGGLVGGFFRRGKKKEERTGSSQRKR